MASVASALYSGGLSLGRDQDRRRTEPSPLLVQLRSEEVTVRLVGRILCFTVILHCLLQQRHKFAQAHHTDFRWL
jgi:hypothetical protein